MNRGSSRQKMAERDDRRKESFVDRLLGRVNIGRILAAGLPRLTLAMKLKGTWTSRYRHEIDHVAVHCAQRPYVSHLGRRDDMAKR